LDLYDQWAYMEKTTQWRYTPSTHVVAALDAALEQYAAAGGQPARLERYTANYRTLINGMAEIGFRVFLDPKIQAPIIFLFHEPPRASRGACRRPTSAMKLGSSGGTCPWRIKKSTITRLASAVISSPTIIFKTSSGMHRRCSTASPS